MEKERWEASEAGESECDKTGRRGTQAGVPFRIEGTPPRSQRLTSRPSHGRGPNSLTMASLQAGQATSSGHMQTESGPQHLGEYGPPAASVQGLLDPGPAWPAWSGS